MAATVKLQKFVISEPNFSSSEEGSNWQHQLVDYQACTRETLWRQHYVTTSKEYLINCHILLQYVKLVFLRLQLVQILCKLIIIWVNCEKKTRSFLWNTVYITSRRSTEITLEGSFFDIFHHQHCTFGQSTVGQRTRHSSRIRRAGRLRSEMICLGIPNFSTPPNFVIFLEFWVTLLYLVDRWSRFDSRDVYG